MTRIALLLSCVAGLLAETPQEQIMRAQVLHRTGDMHAAEQILTQLLRESHVKPDWLVTAYNDLGVICHEQGRTQEAEYWYQKARPLLKPGSPLQIQVLNNLASVYLENGQAGKGERVVEELKRLEPPPGELTTRSQSSLAALHMVRGRVKEAEEVFLGVLAYWDKAGKPREAAVVLNNLGVLAMRRGDFKVATSRLRRAYDSWRQQMGGDHAIFIPTIANYGTALLANGQAAEAEEHIGRALRLSESWHGSESAMTVQISSLYAEALAANGRKKEARAMRSKVERTGSALRPQTVDVLDFKK